MSSRAGDRHVAKTGLQPSYARDNLGLYISISCGSISGQLYVDKIDESNDVLMTVDSECSVTISSLSEGECSPTQPPFINTATSGVNSTSATTDIAIGVIVGGVVAVTLIIALTVIVVIVIAVTISRRRRGKLSFMEE